MWRPAGCQARSGPGSVWRVVCSNTAGGAGTAAAAAVGHPWECEGPAPELLSVLLDNNSIEMCILKEFQDLLNNKISVLLSYKRKFSKEDNSDPTDLVDPGSSVEGPGDGGDLPVVDVGHHRNCLDGDAAQTLLYRVLPSSSSAPALELIIREVQLGKTLL